MKTFPILAEPTQLTACILLLGLLLLPGCGQPDPAAETAQITAEDVAAAQATVPSRTRRPGEPTKEQIAKVVVEALKPDQLKNVPYAGVRFWNLSFDELRVEELEPGRKPANVKRHPTDRFSSRGQTFELPEKWQTTGFRAYVDQMVGYDRFAWVILKDKLLRADCDKDTIEVMLTTESFGDKASFNSVVGDKNGLYLTVKRSSHATNRTLLLQLDPITGTEIGRVSFDKTPGSLPCTIALSEKYVAVGRSSYKPSGVSIVDRATFSEVGFVDAPANVRTSMTIVDDELWVAVTPPKVRMPCKLSRFKLPECTELESGRELPTNSKTMRSWDGNVFMIRKEQLIPVHGQHAENIAKSSGRTFSLPDDMLIHKGFAIATCYEYAHLATQSRKRDVMVIDLSNGKLVMTAKIDKGSMVSIVAPAEKAES